MCEHVIFKVWWCNSIHSTRNWLKKVFIYDLLQGGLSGVALYVPIYDTPNSLLTESMVDREMLLGKELGSACLKINFVAMWQH